MNNIYLSVFNHNEQIYPLITLMYSWKQINSIYPYYLLITPNINKKNRKIIKWLGFKIIEIDTWASLDEGVNCSEIERQDIIAKFKVFDLIQFDKILMLDCDILFLHNTDYLFKYPTITSVSWQPKEFRSECLLLEPNHELYLSLINYVNQYEHIKNYSSILKDFFWDLTFRRDHLFERTSFYSLLDCSNNNINWINEWMKMDIVYMTDENKPWKTATTITDSWSKDWYTARMLYQHYLNTLNYGIDDLRHKKVITKEDLLKPEEKYNEIKKD